jgi:hypothetical protein
MLRQAAKSAGFSGAAGSDPLIGFRRSAGRWEESGPTQAGPYTIASNRTPSAHFGTTTLPSKLADPVSD